VDLAKLLLAMRQGAKVGGGCSSACLISALASASGAVMEAAELLASIGGAVAASSAAGYSSLCGSARQRSQRRLGKLTLVSPAGSLRAEARHAALAGSSQSPGSCLPGVAAGDQIRRSRS